MHIRELDGRFRDIEKRVVASLKARQGKELQEADLLLFGLLSRASALFKGMCEARGNPYVFVLLYRGQIETLAVVNHLLRNPSDASRFLHGGRKGGRFRISNVMTLIDSASKRYPGLRDVYDEISEMAHPNSASHFLSIDREEKGVRWRSEPAFTKEEGEKALKGLLEINSHVADDLNLLVDKLMKEG